MGNPGPLEALAYVTELSQWNAVGLLANAAGIEASAGLPERTAASLGAFAESLGVDPANVTAVLAGASLPPAETGQWGAKAGALAAKAWEAITSNARKLITVAAEHQGLAITIGGLVIAHNWLSQPEAIALAEIREQGETSRHQWNTADPALRAKLVAAEIDKAKAAAGGIGTNTVLLVGAGVLALWILAGAMKGKR